MNKEIEGFYPFAFSTIVLLILVVICLNFINSSINHQTEVMDKCREMVIGEEAPPPSVDLFIDPNEVSIDPARVPLDETGYVGEPPCKRWEVYQMAGFSDDDLPMGCYDYDMIIKSLSDDEPIPFGRYIKSSIDLYPVGDQDEEDKNCGWGLDPKHGGWCFPGPHDSQDIFGDVDACELQFFCDE